MNILIGLAGCAQSGKDSAASALIQDGFERRAFADKVRDYLYRLNPNLDYFEDHYEEPYPLADIVDLLGWDRAKTEIPEVRELLQRCGVAARDVLGEDVWVNATMRSLPALTVVTDVRFPNEVAAIRERGGIVLRVVRKGVEPPVMADGSIHVSETALVGTIFDGTIYNNHTLSDLHLMTRWWVDWLRISQKPTSPGTGETV